MLEIIGGMQTNFLILDSAHMSFDCGVRVIEEARRRGGGILKESFEHSRDL